MDIEARLAALEDERAIRVALERYGHSIDYGREDDWVDCFVDDGIYDLQMPALPSSALAVFSLAEVHDRGLRIRGRAALAQFAALHSRAPETLHKHIVADVIIERGNDPDRARATSYFLRIDAVGNRREIVAFGRYHDTLLRCDDGRWRFVERIAEIESTDLAPAASG